MPPSAEARVLPPRPLRLAAGVGISLGVAGLIALIFWSILAAGMGNPDAAGVDIPDLLRMTGVQAALTTVLSLLVGTALAWSLNRLRFPGRSLLVGLFSSALVTPGMVVAFGLITVWGRNGWINGLGHAIFGQPLVGPIFGLGGILAAHVILDGAFAARIILSRLDALPPARLKLAQSLGLSPWQRFGLVDWPALAPSLPGLAAVIFLLAFTSFPIVLMLGGGPANQTLEVAIYSAVRLDFDLDSAVRLALVQLAICSVVIALTAARTPMPGRLETRALQLWPEHGPTRLLAMLILGLGTLGFALPLLAVLTGGFGPGLLHTLGRAAFWNALWASLSLGTVSALLTLALGLGLTLGRATAAHPLLRLGLSLPAFIYLAVPAVVLALGFFLIVRHLGLAVPSAAPVVVVIANALLALPFALATLGPAVEALVRTRGRLIRSLGISGVTQWRAIEWPLLTRDIGVVLAIAFCFSLGDLGVIAMFGTEQFSTLPLLMYRALGSYRSDDAASIAAILLVLTVAAFALLPPLIERLGHARA